MATKYAGQVGLNKLMQIVKTALGNKADKTNATTSAAGLLSAADKTKLNGIADGANKTTVDAALSSTSTNPVQNKAVKAALDGVATDTVRYGAAQELTFDQQSTARENIGAASEKFARLRGYVTLTPTDGSDGTGVGLSVAGSGNSYSLDISEVNEGEPTRLLGVAAPTGDNDAATKAYVDSKVAAGGVSVDSSVSAESTNPVQNKAVKSYVDGKVSGLQTAEQVQTAINSALTGVYTPKGSVAFASLPTAAAGNKGWVYNITDAFTTTAAFVEGAGRAYAAGTNVVCVDISVQGTGNYKWDVLAGTIDLTELTADEVQTLWDSI